MEETYYAPVAYLQFDEDTRRFAELESAEKYDELMDLAREYDSGDSPSLQDITTSPTPHCGDELLYDDDDYAVVVNNSVGGTYEVLRVISEKELRREIERYGVDVENDSYDVIALASKMVNEEFDLMIKSREPILEFEDGEYVHIRYNVHTNMIETGSVTNTGFHLEESFNYDFNRSPDENLQDVYQSLSEEHFVEKEEDINIGYSEDDLVEDPAVSYAATQLGAPENVWVVRDGDFPVGVFAERENARWALTDHLLNCAEWLNDPHVERLNVHEFKVSFPDADDEEAAKPSIYRLSFEKFSKDVLDQVPCWAGSPVSDFVHIKSLRPERTYARDEVSLYAVEGSKERKKVDNLLGGPDRYQATKVGNDMTEYDSLKQKHPDAIVLLRQGDFYVALNEDAHKVSDILGVTLQGKDKKGYRITPQASFPSDALDSYLPRLVRAGCRVAIAEGNQETTVLKQRPDGLTAVKEEHNLSSNINDMASKKKDSKVLDEPKKAKKAKQEPVMREVDVMGLMNDLKTKGETKLSDHFIDPEKDKKQESKAETKAETKSEEKTEKKHREPQMVTVNGEKVTHGHAYQGKDSQQWFFVAKLDGQMLKPQRMDAADAALYQKKEIGVPELMAKYYPTKLMAKVPAESFSIPNVIAGPKGEMTINKFNVYKEKDEHHVDYGKYKFYAEVDGKKMSELASREDLNAYFDRVKTPAQLVENTFGAKLHLPSHYEQFKLPEGVSAEHVQIRKDRTDNKWKVQVNLGDGVTTSKQALSFDDGNSYFAAKTASKEQIAAKYLGAEIPAALERKNSRGMDLHPGLHP